MRFAFALDLAPLAALSVVCCSGDRERSERLGVTAQSLGAATKIASYPNGAFATPNPYTTAAGSHLLDDVWVPEDSVVSGSASNHLSVSLDNVGFFMATDGTDNRQNAADLYRTDVVTDNVKQWRLRLSHGDHERRRHARAVRDRNSARRGGTKAPARVARLECRSCFATR
jgi:hypothetical protein